MRATIQYFFPEGSKSVAENPFEDEGTSDVPTVLEVANMTLNKNVSESSCS